MNDVLQGVRILDLTRVLAGPYATMMLGDFGADVIKIEQPGIGDDSRQFGPFINGESAYFMSINRNKRSVTLNLKEEKGKKAFFELVEQADVLVENFRPGTMEKLGFGYDVLQKINPKLIYGTISGYGHFGPYSNRAAYDGIIQAMGGIMSITGEKGGKPSRVGVSVVDIIAGMFCASGILAALIYRQNTGQGQKVDIAMLDSLVAFLENAISRYLITGAIPKPNGNMHPSIFPFETFSTKNGEIMITAGNDALWEKLAKAIEKPHLATDQRFSTNALRGANHKAMCDELLAALAEKDMEDWVAILDEAGVPCSPVNTIDKVVNHPQVLAREMIVEVEHPVAGKNKIPGIPIKMEKSAGTIRAAAPILGADTETIFIDMLGYSKEQYHQMKKDGIV